MKTVEELRPSFRDVKGPRVYPTPADEARQALSCISVAVASIVNCDAEAEMIIVESVRRVAAILDRSEMKWRE